jgi:putative Mg2+ transporter-C (MgtC) family protein
MLLSLYGFEEYNQNHVVSFDPARIPSYVISGIGFLGAGTIIVYGGTIRGLTTAASIWAVAGLGLVVGIGMYATAVFTTLIILLSLIFLNNFEGLFRRGRSSVLIEIVALPDLQIGNVVKLLDSRGIGIKKVEIENVENDLRNIFIKVDKGDHFDQISLFEEIANIKFVKNIIRKA